VHDRRKATGSHPAAHLLVDQRPWRQIMRHHAPMGAGLDDRAHSINASRRS
jgi:hypothetical protein